MVTTVRDAAWSQMEPWWHTSACEAFMLRGESASETHQRAGAAREPPALNNRSHEFTNKQKSKRESE
jgi:hypothetical protein